MKTPLARPALALACAFILHPSSFVLAQGSLTPPGAPAATMKTLDQLNAEIIARGEKRTPISTLPFTIGASGSYYVTGNLTTTLGGNGITISASNVTLDLGGFELVGNGAPGNYGIRIGAVRTNVVIRDGTVRNWPGAGVTIENSSVAGCRVERIRALANGASGIVLGLRSAVVDSVALGNGADGIAVGDHSQVLRCTSAGSTGGDGIETGARCVVRECVATGNALHGIRANDSCEVADCSTSANTQLGVFGANGCIFRDCTADSNVTGGFQAGTDGTGTQLVATNNLGPGIVFNTNARLAGCLSRENTGNGIQTSTNAVIESCVTAFNTAIGIVAASGSLVQECTASVNFGASGIQVGGNCTIRHCVADANQSLAPQSQGIFAGSSSLVIGCTVTGTTSTAATLSFITGAGIVVGSGSVVQDCLTVNNAGDGIRAVSNCRIVGNQSNSNGAGATPDAAGIHASGSRNRIDSNHVFQNDRGIDVDSASNTIIRNTAASNTANYDIVANNSVGAIVNPANSAAIAGNGALASSLGTTDPWANFSE
jgi:parallel beta-helix repeat protein